MNRYQHVVVFVCVLAEMLSWPLLARADGEPVPVPDTTTQIAGAKAVLEELESQSGKKREEIKKREEELDRLKLEEAKLKEEMRKATANRENIAKIQSELDALDQKKQQEEKQLKALNDEADELDRRIKDKEGAYEVLVQAVGALQTRVKELQDALDEKGDAGIAQINQKIVVSIDGTVIVSGGGNKADLKDESGSCTIVISLNPALEGKGIGRLAAAKIEGLALVDDATSNKLDIPTSKFDLNQPSIALDRSDICDRNRKSMRNQTELRLRVSFRGVDNKLLEAEYYIRYVRAFLQGDFGVGVYFAGGVLGNVADKTAFAAFPALRLGARFNIPVGDDNRDFYLQPNLIAGGGFVVVAGAQKGTDTTDAAPDASPPTEEEAGEPADILSVFVGGTLEVGKFVEAGYAYDPLNDAHLVVIAPGRALSASVLTF